MSGDRRPYTGQKAKDRSTNEQVPSKADAGTRCGQYISQGIVTRLTRGSLLFN